MQLILCHMHSLSAILSDISVHAMNYPTFDGTMQTMRRRTMHVRRCGIGRGRCHGISIIHESTPPWRFHTSLYHSSQPRVDTSANFKRRIYNIWLWQTSTQIPERNDSQQLKRSTFEQTTPICLLFWLWVASKLSARSQCGIHVPPSRTTDLHTVRHDVARSSCASMR